MFTKGQTHFGLIKTRTTEKQVEIFILQIFSSTYPKHEEKMKKMGLEAKGTIP